MSEHCQGIRYSYLITLLLLFAVVSADITVTTYYESDYRNGSTYYVLDGQSVTLVCAYGLSEGQVYDVRWYSIDENLIFFSKAVVPGTELQGTPWEDRDVTWIYTDTSHRLTIPEVNILTDGIRYSCSVEMNDGTMGYNSDLDLSYQIYDSPDLISLSARGVVSEGISEIIQCTVPSIYPGKELTEFRVRVGSQYYSGGSETESLDSNGVTDTVTYTHILSFTRHQHGQQIHCEVTWGDGPIETRHLSTSQSLEIHFSAITVDLTSSHTGLVTENTEVTFTCVTDESNPVSDIVWTRDGTIVSTGISVSEVSGQYNSKKRRSVLRVTTHRSLNGAQYTCYVEGRESVNDFIDLQVKFPATSITLISTHSGQVSENMEVRLTCITSGANPTAVVVWARDGVTLAPDSSDVTTQPGLYNTQKRVSRLRVTADRTQNGAVYMCTVEETQISQQYSMDVRYPATTVELTLSHTGLVAENTEVIITCVTDESNPVSNIVWTRDGNILSTGTNVSEMTGLYNSKKRRSVLTVTTHRSLNGTEYTCYVEGRESVSDTAQLEVAWPPEAPSMVSVEATGAEQANISWVVGLSGGFQQTFRMVVKKTDSGEENVYHTDHVNPEQGVVIYIIMSGLQPETEYEVRVLSVTDFNGGTQTSSDTISLTTRAKPIVNPKDLDAVQVKSFAIVTWEYKSPDLSYATVILEKCVVDGCTETNVGDYQHHILALPLEKGETFYLVIYLDGLEAYRSEEFTARALEMECQSTTGYQEKTVKGGPWVVVAGIFITITLIFSISVAVYITRRIHSGRKKTANVKNRDKETVTYENTSPVLTYETLKQREQEVGVATYADLTHVGVDTYQNIAAQ